MPGNITPAGTMGASGRSSSGSSSWRRTEGRRASRRATRQDPSLAWRRYGAERPARTTASDAVARRARSRHLSAPLAFAAGPPPCSPTARAAGKSGWSPTACGRSTHTAAGWRILVAKGEEIEVSRQHGDDIDQDQQKAVGVAGEQLDATCHDTGGRTGHVFSSQAYSQGQPPDVQPGGPLGRPGKAEARLKQVTDSDWSRRLGARGRVSSTFCPAPASRALARCPVAGLCGGSSHPWSGG